MAIIGTLSIVETFANVATHSSNNSAVLLINQILFYHFPVIVSDFQSVNF